MFALGIDFITGVAVMTDAASREKSEWPPHPARIFMALVAAHYESKPLREDGPGAEQAWAREREALEWLEGQGAPQMSWPEASPRDVVKVYVPVNDAGVPPNPARVKESEMRGALGVMPDHRRHLPDDVAPVCILPTSAWRSSDASFCFFVVADERQFSVRCRRVVRQRVQLLAIPKSPLTPA